MNVETENGNQSTQTHPKTAEIRVIHSANPPSERTMTSAPAKEPLMKRLIRWICPDQRVANRHTMPPLTAWLGMIRSSKEYKVADVSVAGFYMLTEERWIPGTSFPVTLERTDEGGAGRSLTVQASVVRTGDDGVAFTFLQDATKDAGEGPTGANNSVDLTKLAQFLKGLPLDVNGSDPLERAS
jgi:hypothetical protein